MSEESALKDFLRTQARSLDSLLELTPAKTMFGEDVSDQWQRKKQTPEQKKAARLAKLDPANWKSAKDVYDERSAEAAKKRKRQQEGESSTPEPSTQQDQPPKKQKQNDGKAVPKPKPTEKLTEAIDADQLQNTNLKKKLKKRAHKAEKNQQKREEKQRRKEQPAQTIQTENTNSEKGPSPEQAKQRKKERSESRKATAVGALSVPLEKANKSESRPKPMPVVQEEFNEDEQDDEESGDEEAMSCNEDGDASKLEQTDAGVDMLNEDKDQDVDMSDAESTATSSEAASEMLSPPQDSAASSVSSIVPPPIAQPSGAAPKHKQQSKDTEIASTSVIQTEAEREAARQRLQEQISQFRTQRKADDKPVRSRAELLAQRRHKEQERKAAKKEQRRKEKEEEAKQQDEEMARRFSPGGSGSLLASPRSPMIDDGGSNAFTFGRIAFDDGTAFDAATGSVAANKKHKGPADPATALKAAQAKQARVAGLDDQKKQTIEEKDMWLNAKKRAHGERVKDDTSLLKKALKRQEKTKERSGKEWDTRTEGVRSSQEAKQKKRTENLQKRKDEKAGIKPAKKKVKRPGFEGSFKSRAGKGKK